MFFEKTAVPWVPIARGIGALTGAVGAGEGTRRATEGLDMNPLARGVQIGQNTLLGGIAGGAPDRIVKGVSHIIQSGPMGPLKAIGLVPAAFGVEEAIPQGINLLMQKGHETAQNTATSAQEAATSAAGAKTQELIQKYMPQALGGAGLLGLAGIAAYLAKPNKGTFAPSGNGNSPTAAPPGRMLMTLPGSKQNPNPTMIELPLTNLKLPQRTMRHISRDTKRMLRMDNATRDMILADPEHPVQPNG